MSNSAAFDDEAHAAREYAPLPFVMPLAMVQGGIFGNSAPCPNCERLEREVKRLTDLLDAERDAE